MSPTTDPAGARFLLFATAFGTCGLAWRSHGLVRMQLPAGPPPTTARLLAQHAAPARPDEAPAFVGQAIEALCSYFKGGIVDFRTLCVNLSGMSVFHQRVYTALRDVPWGTTTTYGALAARVDAPNGARAIGQAMARNPLPIIIPCHRVLASHGKIGGFSAPGGADTKERLLHLEGISAPATPPLLALLERT